MATAIHQARLNHLEDVIRTTVQTKRIRVNEFFMDFDKLRSGYVTDNQFFRTLFQNIGLKFTPEEEKLLSAKYDIHKNGRINWREFAQTIDQPFDPNLLISNPSDLTQTSPAYYGTSRTVRPLSPEAEEKLRPMLMRMNQFYKYHGVDLRRCYIDFDQINIGVVTESQFYRSFPGPPDLSDMEISLLVRKYRDPSRDGMVNYMNIYNDLIFLDQLETEKKYGSIDKRYPVKGAPDILPQEPYCNPSVQMILDRIRIAVHKFGIRIMDFMRDYDKLRHDKLTENKFICALSLAIGKEAQLSREDTQMLANFYRNPDNTIRYREFCQAMDNPFCVQNMEKNPLVEAPFPPSGSMGRALQRLSDAEEQRVNELIFEISNHVRRKRIMMYSYFKDYDRSKAYTRVVTPNQFGRMLHFLSLDVSPEDCRLLCRKFADPTSNDVNYAAFVQCVDELYCGQTVDPENPEVEIKPERDWEAVVTPVVSTVGDDVSLDTLMARIRHIVLTNRIRAKSFFEDFDTLRSGKMPEPQFRRCLTQIGLSKLDQHDLTDRQYQTLLNRYRDINDPTKVVYTDFLKDVDVVFTANNLESNPTEKVIPQECFVAPKPGTMDWSNAPEDLVKTCENAMARMRQKVAERRMLVKPDFEAFDKVNHGHVTLQNFRQLMTMLNLNLTEEEMDAVAARFADDEGFNYFAYLKELEPRPPEEFKYVKRLQEMREINSKKGSIEREPILRDAEAVLHKVRTEVFRRRLRLSEYFRDYDKLRHGVINRSTFRRALNSATIHLPESELSLIEDRFQGPERESIYWSKFCEEIEEIFAIKNLEKDPIKEPELFKPPPDVYTNQLSELEAELVRGAVKKVAEKVRQRRIQLTPQFKDFDPVNTMTVSQSRFRRVLMKLDLASVLSEGEWAVLYKAFRHPMGISDDVNYLAFSDAVYEMGGFEYRMP